nr:uncharacterized protein CFP56_30716 [Quercus suber]
MKQQNTDEEAATASSPPLNGHLSPYHDNDSDDDATLRIAQDDSTLLNGSYRPSFDGLRLGRSQWSDWISHHTPAGVKTAWAKTVIWVKGPDPPRIYSITPFFPDIQHAPLVLLDRVAPKKIHRFWLLILLYASWLLSFSLILRASSFSASIPGHGSPVRLGCGARYWSDKNGCGINGDGCRPFTNSSLAFRCPADCHKTLMLTPHAVGDQEVVYKPLVVGGPTEEQTGFEGTIVDNAVYRGDSFICASAVHAGFIKEMEGGCGVLTLTGEQRSFAASKHHGINSTGFDSYFPHSFGFASGTTAQCKDLRWPALAISVFWTTVLSLFTTSPIVFFWSIFSALFFHVALASDPPDMTNYYSLLSIAFGQFLPASFCGWVTYRYTVQRSLTGVTAQIEKTILWLGPAWVGALNNYTFDRIPIQRLTPHDIQAQPGAIPALIIVVSTILCIALGQAWSFRIEGRMPRYLLIYGLMVISLLVMVLIPGLSLRIHHYILALLLLPGTAFQNRPSLIYQGLLTGLFINGIARWGFASILETPSALLEGFQEGSLLPTVTALAIGARNITFNLGSLPRYDPKRKTTYDGISVLVNDVERFRGYADDRGAWHSSGDDDNDDDNGSGNYTWTWTKHRVGRVGHAEAEAEAANDTNTSTDVAAAQPYDYPEYFRFAYVAGNRAADFSKAGVWQRDGEWKKMEDGPSRRT